MILAGGRFRAAFLLWPGVSLLLFSAAGCGAVLDYFNLGSNAPPGPAPRRPAVTVPPETPVFSLVDEFGPGSGGNSVLALAERQELQRLRAEHAALIDSIPTRVPESVDSPDDGVVVEGSAEVAEVDARADAVVARVLAHPDGIPLPNAVGENWFDPDAGIDFFRASGGDWTERSVRRNHTHRGLFYYEDYPDGVPHFADESIYPQLSRELAFAGARVLPLLGDPVPEMIEELTGRLGWELRDAPGPVINLWSRIRRSSGGELQVYVIAGVMELQVVSLGDRYPGGDEIEYLLPGPWIGPVVVERVD